MKNLKTNSQIWKRMQSILGTLLAVCLLLSSAAGCGPDTAGKTVVSSGPSAETHTGTVTGDEFSIPAYDSSPSVELNGNEPLFSEKERKNAKAFEEYAPLDSLGRCGVAYACVGKETMPTEERGAIGMVRPSGWHTIKYDFIDGKYLYNRCHLIGYQLTGENATEENLITGTRYLNVIGMLPLENEIADYVEQTGNHVLYRVTPVFTGDNLVADGVRMEAYSVEDGGKGVSFHVYCYNVQPGVTINYADGTSSLSGQQETEGTAAENDFVLNSKSGLFHKPSCSGVKKMSKKNRTDYHGTREKLIQSGYDPCSMCNP